MSRALQENLPLPEQLTVAVVDQSADVHGYARDEAFRQYTDMMNGDGGRLRGFVRNIWKGQIFREYYVQKYTAQAEKQISNDNSLYIGASEEARRDATEATLGRFISEFDETIHEDAGESRKWLDENASSEEARVVSRVRGLIERFARGDISDGDDLTSERKRLFEDLANDPATADLVPKGELYADNIEVIARTVRSAIEHGVSMDEALSRVAIVTGEARTGVRTEAHYNRIDKVIEKVNSSKIGSLVARPTAVASVVSIAASLAGAGSRKVVAAAGMTLAPGLAGAGIAAVKESKRIKDDRRQHSREVAQGNSYTVGASKREKLEATRYETVSASDLRRAMEVVLDASGTRNNLTDSEAKNVVDNLSQAIARTRLSDRTDSDFISYESLQSVENERLLLDLRIAEAKVALRKSLEGANAPSIRSILNLDDAAGAEEAIESAVALTYVSLENDIEHKDTAFKSLRRKEVAKAAAKAAVIGTVVGIIAQEGLALVDGNRLGMVEDAVFSTEQLNGQHETLLQGAFSENDHSFTTESMDHTAVDLTKNSDISLPEGYTLEADGKNSYEVIDGSGRSIAAFKLRADGTITDKSLSNLYDQGIRIGHTTEEVTELVEKTNRVDLQEFLAENRTHRIDRQLWYDNNSTAYDKNELGLWWGGKNNVGLDSSGNFRMTVSNMTADGSFHNGQAVNWQTEANAGRLQLAISASESSQNKVFFVPIDSEGNAIIKAGSPEAQLFKTDADGQPLFKGHYVEVVHLNNPQASGVQDVSILATHIGERTAETSTFTSLEQVPVDKTINHYSFNIERAGSDFIEMAPFIPVYGRKSLEQILREESHIPYYHRSELTPDEVERRSRHFSPRLLNNPEAVLDEGEEIDWYFDQQTPDHLKRVSNNAEQIGPMDKAVDAVVTIPVAGHQEADNIYRTLEAYADQTLAKDRFEILLYVNNPVNNEAGEKLDSDATLEEINRFKLDYPDMPVKVMHEELPRSEAKIGKIRKTLVDTALARHKDRLDAGHTTPLMLVSNDADAIRINPHYLETMLAKLHEDNKLEAVIGQVDWDNKAYVNYPEVHVGTRLFQFFDTMLRNKDGLIASTSGANTAFRASMYAAVGGYKSEYSGGGEIIVGEDVELGRDMRAGRYKLGIDPVGWGGTRASRIETSARRSVWAFLNYYDAPYNQWNYGFSADDDEVRGINVDTLTPLNYNDTAQRETLLKNIQHIVNKTLERMAPSGSVPSTGSATSAAGVDSSKAEYIARSLRLMGIDFEWNGSYKSITITNGDRLLEGLAAYARTTQRKIIKKTGAAALKIVKEIDESSGVIRLRDETGRFVSKDQAISAGVRM